MPNNDVMIDELEMLVDEFPGAANHTRCFTHIVNLVVKSILWQFDVPKARTNEVVDEATEELRRLAEEIETEEEATICEFQADSGGTESSSEDDNVEGWVDERENLSNEELEAMDEALKPVCFLLAKVSIMK
jgi:nucleoside-diphosphate-sugar epimerase